MMTAYEENDRRQEECEAYFNALTITETEARALLPDYTGDDIWEALADRVLTDDDFKQAFIAATRDHIDLSLISGDYSRPEVAQRLVDAFVNPEII